MPEDTYVSLGALSPRFWESMPRGNAASPQYRCQAHPAFTPAVHARDQPVRVKRARLLQGGETAYCDEV